MPAVPTYRRQVATQGLPQARAIAEGGDTSGLQRGLADVSNVATQIMEKKQQEADTTSLLEADNKLTEWQNNAFYNKDNGVFTKKGQHAIDVTGQTLSEFDKAQQEIGSSLSNERQRARFSQVVQQRKQSISNDLNRYEYGEHQRYMDDVDTASVQLSIDSAALNPNDPNKVGFYKQKALDVVQNRADRLGWSAEETALQKLNTSSKLLTGVIGRVAQDNLGAAKQMFESNKDGLSADAQLRLTDNFQQEQRRLDAEARQRQVEARQMQAINRMELSGRVQDAQSAYLQGLDFKNPPSKADFVAAYGPEKANDAYQEFAKVQAVAPAIREFATADPQERQAILQKFQPAQDGVAGEGFKEDSQLYQHLTSVGLQLMKQQQTDPAGYAVKYSPIVQKAFETAQNDGSPEAYQAYAVATAAEQKRLGVAQPKLLPAAAADQFAATFNLKVEGGENAATMIEQQAQLWGKDFPSVLQQVGDKLPAEAQVIATSLPKDLAERMASVASIKDSDLNSGLQKGQKDEVGQSVQQAMQPFAESLQGQTGGIGTYSTMYKAAVRTATSYVLQGDSPKDAAQKVVNGMVNDKYDFFGTYRVPKTLDTKAVSRGAEEALRRITPEELMPLPGISGVAETENARQLHEALQSGGQWVPTNDESGLALTLNGYRVRGKDGKPLVKSWAELQQQGITAPIKSGAPSMGIYN